MSAPRLMLDREELAKTLIAHGWNKTRTAAALGVHRQTVARLCSDYGLTAPLEPAPEPIEEEGAEDTFTALEGSVRAEVVVETASLPKPGKIFRYILTSAQNNTMVHPEMWESLLNLADYYKAGVMVSRYTYNKGAYRQAQQAKPGSHKVSDTEQLWYDPVLDEYIVDHRVVLAPDLEFCGEMNILPTAVRPLSGLETYTKDRSAIFPHTKMAMTSVPAMKFKRVKFNYTTGTVTQRNYIQRKTGLKAGDHHVYGAALVEVNSDGDWWVRQLMSTDDGVIQDLDVIATPEGVSTDHNVEAIVWGDIHNSALEREVYDLSWGPGGMFDQLRPNYQFLHDVLDFRTRTYHDNGNHHKRYAQHLLGTGNVAQEIADLAGFLASVEHPDCETMVVESNHDAMFSRWLAEGDYKNDPENAVYFLEMQLKKYRAITFGKKIHLLETACRDVRQLRYTKFLDTDESFVVKGIECALHGHRGPDGTRGTAANLNRMGVKVCSGHSHSARIHDGVWSCGVMGSLDQGYNVGPSTWSHTNTLIYQTGKRAQITYRNGGFRA